MMKKVIRICNYVRGRGQCQSNAVALSLLFIVDVT